MSLSVSANAVQAQPELQPKPAVATPAAVQHASTLPHDTVSLSPKATPASKDIDHDGDSR